MSVNAISYLVLGWSVDCEAIVNKEPRFDPKTGKKVKNVSKFSRYVLRVGGLAIPAELMNNTVYDEGDVGLMYSTRRRGRYSRNEDDDDQIVEITGMCYGQVIFTMSDSPFDSTEKGCNTVYPVLYEVSAKLKRFQAEHNLPEPTLFAELSFG